VIAIIDAAYNEPDHAKRLLVSYLILTFLRGLQHDYPRSAIKQSRLFYKLSGSSVEDISQETERGIDVAQIDAAIIAFVRGELQTFLAQ
jgi:hypothetical protein